LVRGDPEKLGRLRVDPEFERLMDRCAVCCDHVGVVMAVVDDQVMRALGLWGEEIGDLI
jgi:hypothetical protein